MTLEKLALEMRTIMLGRRQSKGHCWFVSNNLCFVLKVLGHDVTLTEGRVGGVIHHWLTLHDGRILDATADQFSTPANPMPKVYLGPKPANYCENETPTLSATAP